MKEKLGQELKEKLFHEMAWILAGGMLEYLRHRIQKSERRKVFYELYRRARAGLETFEIKADEMRPNLRELRPSKN